MVHERQEKIASRSSKVRPPVNVFNALNCLVNHGFQRVCLSGWKDGLPMTLTVSDLHQPLGITFPWFKKVGE